MAVTADAGRARLAEIAAVVDPDAIQLNGGEPPELIGALARPTWKVLHLPADAPADLGAATAAVVAAGRTFLAAGAEQLMLDTAGGPYPGGTGTRAAAPLAAAVARELPVTLAGGLDPANVGPAVLAIPAVGVDVASGVEAPRVAGERPVKDPLRVALFAKRARAARADRPHVPARPTPVHPGLLEADVGRSLGCRPGIRRALRAGDAHGRARSARACLPRDPPGSPVLGRVPRAAGDLLRPADADLPGRPARGGRPGDRPAPARVRV